MPNRKTYWSIYDEHKDEIINLIEEGYSLRDIHRTLFKNKEGYEYATLASYVARHRKKGNFLVQSIVLVNVPNAII